MKAIFNSVKAVLTLGLLVLGSQVSAQNVDPNLNYYINGSAVTPWAMELQFGQIQMDGNLGETAKSRLMTFPGTKNAENDAIHLVWSKKAIKTEWGGEDEGPGTISLINKLTTIDLSPVKDGAALVFDVKVNTAPKKAVKFTMESAWDWKTRASVPLDKMLKKLPKKQWISVPIPLQCLDNGKLDFSKISTVFMMYSSGKLDIEIGDIRLSAFPADKVKC